MQAKRRERLARQLNETALALIAEARIAEPREAKELRELATELDRMRVSMLSGERRGRALISWQGVQAA